MKRSTPLKRTAFHIKSRTVLTRSTRLKPMSDKRVAVNNRRRAIKATLKGKRGLWCELCGLIAWCDVHEPWSRGRGGPIDDERNMVCLCRKCHDCVVEKPAWAESLGLLIPGAEGRAWLEAGGWRGPVRRAK